MADEVNPAVAYEKLKAETAKMLALDVASSSLLENLQVDLVSLLRLQIDDLQGQVLAGQQVDLVRLSTALGMLRQLLPERALVSEPPAAETRFGPDHKARLRDMIQRVVFAGAEEEAARLADACAREEAAMAADALGIPPEASSEGAVVSPVPSEGATTGAPTPASSPAPQRETAEERMARVNRQPPPARYLRGPDEPWRRHVNEDGIISGPWGR